MNQRELIDRISEDVNITKQNIELVINSFQKIATAALVKGEKVKFVGFGTLSPRKRKARKGRNPQNGVEIQIPPRKSVTFRTGSELAKKLNKQKG